jgi:hypothetical protein
MLHRVQATDTSQYQLFRGDRVIQAFMVELLQRNHYKRTPIRRRDLLGLRNTLDRWRSVPWSHESKLEIFGSNRCFFVRRRLGELMISAFVVPTVKSMEEEV